MSPKHVKSKLSKEKIIKMALKLIEKKGLAQFSMRDLAQEIGIEPMSLYYYFPSRLDLLNGALDSIVGGCQFLDRQKGWEKRLRHAAGEWMRMARENPAFYQFLAIHRMNSEAAMTFLHAVLEIFVDSGLSREKSARYFRATGYFLMGAALDETMGYSKGPSATQVLTEEEEQKRFPLVYEVGEYFVPEHFEKTFQVGLDALIFAIKSEIKPRSED